MSLNVIVLLLILSKHCFFEKISPQSDNYNIGILDFILIKHLYLLHVVTFRHGEFCEISKMVKPSHILLEIASFVPHSQ